VSGSVPSGAMVNATLRAKLRFNMPSGANSYSTLYLYGDNGAGRLETSVIFLQVVAYASDNTPMGASGVKLVSGKWMLVESAMRLCGYTPPYATDQYEQVDAGTASKISAGVFELDNEIVFQVEAQDVAYYKLYSSVYKCETEYSDGFTHNMYSGTGTSSRATLYQSYSTKFQADTAFIVNGSGNTITMTNPDSIRSGALVTKQMLLSTSGTPADYLVSLCKILGLYFVTDTVEKKVTILTRNDLYIDETIDLTEMVDTLQDIEIVPLVFDSKWYKFALAGVGGAFYDEYLDIEGVEYGVQMVDTGFDFNAEVKDLLDGNVYRNAVTVLQSSRYWNIIDDGGDFIPSPFLDTGNTITRWNASDETQDTPISCPPSSATITYYNNTYNGYDINAGFKLQLADADGKMVDGKDVLVYINRFETYASFKVTDDLPVMGAVNDGKPCWILDEGAGVDVPCFSRYISGWRYGKLHITDSLDFGIPRQLDIPSVIYNDTASVYDNRWRAYITDRYDVDTQVMRCKVHFKGMQVNHELLRRFYYFDGCLWVLNKITNHSLTTYDPVECEFIKVQDKDNYLTGQDY